MFCTCSNGVHVPATVVGLSQEGCIHLEYFQDAIKVVNPNKNSTSPMGPVFFFRCGLFFFRGCIFLAKKNNPHSKIFCAKKILRAKKNTQTFFFCAEYFFLARMPQILEVVKKVLWAIPWAPVGERGVCGDPVTARVMKQV